MARVVWTHNAADRLEAIVDYIEKESPAYIRLFLERVFELADMAAEFPRMGRVVPEFHQDTLREVMFQNYRIVYRIVGEDIRILTIRHGAMDPRSLRSELRDDL